MTPAEKAALSAMANVAGTALRLAAAGHDAEVKADVDTMLAHMTAAVRAVEAEDGSR